ncbi:DUF362 domain-containing protein [Thermodesulfobacteriota bacterium]
MAKVLIRNAEYENATQVLEGIFDELGLDLRGKSVLLKPNFGAAVGPEKAASTNASLVKSVLDVCLKQTSDVVIGENPGNLDTGALHTVKMTGILDLAGDYYENISKEAEFVDIGSEILPRVFISKKISEVDYLINVPKMKTHILAGLSCCLKNVYGYVVGAMKARYHVETKSVKRLTQLWLDLYKYRTPDLNVVDAIIAMEGGGPTHGDPRKVGKVVVGENGLEVDVVLLTMMGWDPKKIKLIEMAHEQGLCEMELDKIDIVGDFEILPEFKRPPTFALDPKLNPYEGIANIHPTVNEDVCSICRLCGDESCPAEAITFDPYPLIDEQKCISCYCCVEFCPEGALSVEYDKELSEVV